MSRNLELLERAERDAQLLQRTAFPNSEAYSSGESQQQVVMAAPSRHPGACLSKSTQRQISAMIESLFLSSPATAPRGIGFCGVDNEGGPSWISACAAELASSRLEGDICLVDANVRTPSVHHHFGLENQYGLTEALRDKFPISLYLRRMASNLVFLSAGTALSDPGGGSINGDATRSCFADLRAAFDYLLVNVGSSLTSQDAVALSQCLDGVVLVLEANSTPRPLARETRQSFESAGVKLFGAVLNNKESTVPSSIEFLLQRLA